jgi:hypothetical protein
MSKKTSSSRRDFLKQSASLAAASGVIPYIAWNRSLHRRREHGHR